MNEFNSNLSFTLTKRKVSLEILEFAIIAKDKNAITYYNFLKEKEIFYKTATISDYDVFWGFSGDINEINKLRSLISK